MVEDGLEIGLDKGRWAWPKPKPNNNFSFEKKWNISQQSSQSSNKILPCILTGQMNLPASHP